MADRTWTGSATARAGVAGNPSDALGGAALAVPVPGLAAEVVLRDADRLVVRRADGVDGWSSVPDLVLAISRVGHDGAERLVTAAVVTLHQHLVGCGTEPDPAPFEVVWRTDIPRSVGLAGSSALVIATLRALTARWDVELSPPDLARLALAAEVDELGIAAGWMDRAVQAYDAPTLVHSGEDRAAVPVMEVVEPGGPLDLVVAWDPAGAAPSGRLHRDLRVRLDSGDAEVAGCVDALVATAHAAVAALRMPDPTALAAAVGRSCALRERLGALDSGTAALVGAALDAGGVATSAGSGGAVLIVPTTRTARQVRATLAERGLPNVAVPLAPGRVPR